MAQKHHGDVEFLFPNGLLKTHTGTEALQIYHVYEQEFLSEKHTEIPFFDTDTMLLIYGVRGEGTILIESREYLIMPHTVFLIPYTSHCVQLHTNGSFSYVGIAFSISLHAPGDWSHLYTRIQYNDPLYAKEVLQIMPFITGLISELCLDHSNHSLIEGMMEQILITLHRNFIHCKDSLVDYEHTSHIVGHTVYAIVRYIDDNLYSIHNLSDMAKELGYSYNYLSHLFRRKTGSTIQAYVSRKKIEKSRELLSDSRYSVTEIASLLNYDCIQSFSKAFKKAMGVSPTEYRESVGLAISTNI